MAPQECVHLTLIDFYHDHSYNDQLLRKVFSLQQAKQVKRLLLLDDIKLIEYDPDNFHLILENRINICREELDQLLDNEEFMMKVVSIDGKLFHFASERLQKDYPLMLATVKQNGMMLFEMSERYFTDELVLEAVKQDGQAFPDFGRFGVENQVAMAAVENNGLALENISGIALTDKVIDVACEENPLAREFLLTEKIRNPHVANLVALYSGIDSDTENDEIERKVLKKVMKIHPESQEFLEAFNLSDEQYFELTKTALKYSQDLSALKFNGFSIEEYEKLAKYDGEILSMVDECYHTRRMVYNAVRNNGALDLAVEELRDDHYLMKEAVKLNPGAICSSGEVKHFRLCVLDYVKVNGEVLEYVWQDYNNDREIVLNAVLNYGLALGFASNELQKDEEIVMAAISNCGLALEYVDDKFFYNKEVILKAVSQNGLALEQASFQDEEIVMAALNQTVLAFEFVEEKLITKEIIMTVIEQYPYFYSKARSFKHDRDVTLFAVSKLGGNLSHAPKELKSDREIVLAAVSSCGLSLQYADSKLADDSEIAKAAILNNPFSIKYASKRLRLDLSFARLAKELNQADLNRFDSWQDIIETYKKRSLSDLYDTESDTDDDEEEILSDDDPDDTLDTPPTKLSKLEELPNC